MPTQVRFALVTGLSVLACASGCSSSARLGDDGLAAQSEPDAATPGDDGASPSDDTLDGGGGEGAASCEVSGCPQPGVGTACCTAPGTGQPGDILEPVGRAPGLCGANLGAFDPSLDACVQLRQPGVPDPACPAQTTLAGGTTMPGCCTDEGFCGSIDTLGPFGCFYATGLHGLPCEPSHDGDAGS